MEKSGFRTATDVNHDGHELSNFPILCETCLGDNPYVRMLRQHSGKECKICARPYSVFRWKPGPKARFKQTIVCQICAKLKNVCQTCLFDLEYGLPVQVRDRYLEEQQLQKIELPESRVNRDYMATQFDKLSEQLPYGKSVPHATLTRMARHAPYYKRNRPRICSFWVRGECARGSECPFLHEDEGYDPTLADQNIKDRYVGQDDPVAEKIFRKTKEASEAAAASAAASDSTITSSSSHSSGTKHNNSSGGGSSNSSNSGGTDYQYTCLNGGNQRDFNSTTTTTGKSREGGVENSYSTATITSTTGGGGYIGGAFSPMPLMMGGGGGGGGPTVGYYAMQPPPPIFGRGGMVDSMSLLPSQRGERRRFIAEGGGANEGRSYYPSMDAATFGNAPLERQEKRSGKVEGRGGGGGG